MTAIAILIVAVVFAWLWTRVIDGMTGEEAMTGGAILLAPYAVILVATIVALIVWA